MEENVTMTAEGGRQPEKKKSKVVSIIVDVILALAILFGVFCAYTAFVSKDSTGVPSIFGIRIFVVQSDSMSPTFEKDDVLIGVKVKDASKLEASTSREAKDGDIITFETVINSQAALNSHRIVGKTYYETADGGYWEFTTRGDNAETNKYDDSIKVRDKSIVAQYKFRIKGLGKFINFMQTKWGFGLVIVLPVLIFFLWQVVQFFRSLFAYQAEKVRLQFQSQMGVQNTSAPAPADKKEDEPDGGEEKKE